MQDTDCHLLTQKGTRGGLDAAATHRMMCCMLCGDSVPCMKQ